jgi:hypothetical protein
MKAFLQHVGHQNLQHLKDTVTSFRTFQELLDRLPITAPERHFFENNDELGRSFPDGRFNCWGLMNRAEARFRETEVGDLVLMIPTVGIHGGGVHQLGIVKAKCPIRCFEATKILWPNIEDPSKLYPFLFFFESEIGYRSWVKFIEDLGYDEKYNPRGYYTRIEISRFDRWGGVEGYLEFLRTNCDFKRLEGGQTEDVTELEKVRIEEEAKGFDPSDIEDARKRILSSIVVRQGRQAFRESVLTAYGRSCAVTGCEVVEVLEAAHIMAYRGPETNCTSNGILLRSDLHTLFDLGIIAIDPQSFHVVVSKELVGTSYEELAGRLIRLPTRIADRPAVEVLRLRMAEFTSRESGKG